MILMCVEAYHDGFNQTALIAGTTFTSDNLRSATFNHALSDRLLPYTHQAADGTLPSALAFACGNKREEEGLHDSWGQ